MTGNPAVEALDGFRFHRLIQVPREVQLPGRKPPDDTARGLAAALSGSHADLLNAGAGAALMTAWIRPADDRQLRFLLGGRPYFPPAIDNLGSACARAARPVLFPPGALAVDVPGSAVAGLLSAFPSWAAVTGNTDALWAAEDMRAPGFVRRGSFDRYAAHLRHPFAWLVLARPLRAADVQPELDRLVNDILPLARGEVSEAKRVALERRQGRHRELARSQGSGFWQVQVLVGATHVRAAASAAAMLSAACELDGLPYTLVPAGPTRSLADATQAETGFTASTRLLVALTRPPDQELPGLRLVQPHTFDVTPEFQDPAGLVLGRVLGEDQVEVGDVRLTRDALNRHTLVCGATGTGKSQTVRHLLEQATRAGIPWLVIEPAKAEYARMASRVSDIGAKVLVIRPGTPDQSAAGLNPLEPAPDFPLQTHADLLRALFLASFEAQEPFPQILAAALTRCYTEAGWDLTLGEPAGEQPFAAGLRDPGLCDPGLLNRPRYPALSDLQRVASAIVDEIGYSQEIADNVRGFIEIRLASLRIGTTGRFFEGGHPIDFERLHHRNVVMEIEDIGDDADKAFFMGVILIRLVEHLRISNQDSPSAGLRHLTVIEEAHRLLRRQDNVQGPAAHEVEMFAALLAETRAYGEGLVIAEQIPTKLIPDVIKNTAIKIMHRLPAADDRVTVGATMNLDEPQSEYVLTLRNGDGAVFTDGMDRPMLVRMPDGTHRENAEAAPAAPVTAIIGRRSITCGPECTARACTLRDMQGVRQALKRHAWLVVWAELAAVAHLVGHRMPVPDGVTRQAAGFGELSARTRDCALAQAVDEAVATRSSILLRPGMDDFVSVHIVGAMRAVLDGGRHDRCTDAWKYLSRPHQWLVVRHLLARCPETSGPHPQTAEWQERYGRAIPGNTAKEQLGAVQQWLREDLDNTRSRGTVNFGARRPSILESAIGASPGDPGWDRQLLEAIRPFENLTWPVEVLETGLVRKGG